MNNKELILKRICKEFAVWQVRIDNLSSLNLYDANIFSEDSICEVLNVILGYELKNVNLFKVNFPSIDLADKYNRIAVQVTSDKSARKIQSTLDMFFKKNFENDYDELFVVILGDKQRKYSKFPVKKGFFFTEDKNIIDFKDLLKMIRGLSLRKSERIMELLNIENAPLRIKGSKTDSEKLQNKLDLKRKIDKAFRRELPEDQWRQSRYEPYIKFNYSKVIIRSFKDESFPDDNEPIAGQMSPWFKGVFWDFYENGIELIRFGHSAIFDKEGNWDLLNWEGDEREKNTEYTKIPYDKFLRIPYEYIIDYDMEADEYLGLPTIYVDYAKDGMPYEEIVYGVAGYYNKENELESSYTRYFDNDKRMKLT